MTRLQRKLQKTEANEPASTFRKRRDELSQLAATDRIAAIGLDLKSLPREISEEIVFHHKKLLRMWDAARIEAGLVTPMDVQRENSPVSFERMAKATLTFKPRLRV